MWLFHQRKWQNFLFYVVLWLVAHSNTHTNTHTYTDYVIHLNISNYSLSCRKDALQATYGPTCSSLVFEALAKVSGNALDSPLKIFCFFKARILTFAHYSPLSMLEIISSGISACVFCSGYLPVRWFGGIC